VKTADPPTDPRRRLVLFAAALLIGGGAGVVFVGPIRDELIAFVEQLGATAPVAFVLLYALLSLALVPGSLLSVAAGVLFGAVTGTVLAVLGGVLGSSGAFLIGRRVGRAQVERLAGRRLCRLDVWLRLHGAPTIAIVRIIPGVPYSLLNYAAGVTGISTRDYVLGTAVGLVPGAFVYAAFGETLDDPLSLRFLGAVAALVLFLAAGMSGERWLRARAARA
jgi:uncharacterized membrane protein YdjX (TVP38/TMEM64 family)